MLIWVPKGLLDDFGLACLKVPSLAKAQGPSSGTSSSQIPSSGSVSLFCGGLHL